MSDQPGAQQCFFASWPDTFMPNRFHHILQHFDLSIASTKRQILRSISAPTCPRPALVVLWWLGGRLVGLETLLKPHGWPAQTPTAWTPSKVNDKSYILGGAMRQVSINRIPHHGAPISLSFAFYSIGLAPMNDP